MTDIREQLGRHLTAHGASLEIGIRSTDVADLLEHMDFAMACGLIGPRRAAILLAKYTGDTQEERKCRAWWLARVIEYAHLRAWHRPRQRMLEALAYTSMDEHIGHGTRCAVCNGTKERMVNNLPVICPGCEGRGFLEYGADVYCAELGIGEREWQNAWASRVDWARRSLRMWELDAAQALRERVG